MHALQIFDVFWQPRLLQAREHSNLIFHVRFIVSKVLYQLRALVTLYLKKQKMQWEREDSGISA